MQNLEMFSTFGVNFGFHGQTLAHDQRTRHASIGGRGQLAQRLARPVVWDFRSADVGRGGQGAPRPVLPFCVRKMDRCDTLAVLNLGGEEFNLD